MTVITLPGLHPESRKRWRLADGDLGPVSLPKVQFRRGHARSLEAARSADVAIPKTVRGPAGEKWVLVDGKYRPNESYNPRFDITLGQAIGIPPLVAAAAAALPALSSSLAGGLVIGGSKVGSAVKAAERFRQTYPPGVAEALSQPYPARGMGEHVIPRRVLKDFPFLAPVVNHPANILRRPTKGEMYELHYKCDNHFDGTKLPRGLEEKGWSGAKAGLERYGPLRWAWHCTTPAMKVGTGVIGAAGVAAHEHGHGPRAGNAPQDAS